MNHVLPKITGVQNRQQVDLLLKHGVPKEWWPRTLGRPVFVTEPGWLGSFLPETADHPEIIGTPSMIVNNGMSGYLVTTTQ